MLAPQIRVNAVAQGLIWTPLIPSTFDPEKVESFGKDTSMKRPGEPFERAGAYVYFASEDATHVTGQTIHRVRFVPSVRLVVQFPRRLRCCTLIFR